MFPDQRNDELPYLTLSAQLAGVNSKKLIGRTPTQETREKRDSPQKEPFISGANKGQRNKNEAQSDSHASFNRMYILFHKTSFWAKATLPDLISLELRKILYVILQENEIM